jgi:hypothetical protein
MKVVAYRKATSGSIRLVGVLLFATGTFFRS